MITVLCGKSASGKDTLFKELIERGFEPIISTTSRPMREGETEGKEYNFVTREEFEKRLAEGRFLEHRSYDTLVNGNPDTWYYGMEKREYDRGKDYLVILDLEGAKAFKEAYKDDVFVVGIEAPDTKRKEWAESRGSFDETEWNRRFEDDKVKFAPENMAEMCDTVIQNTTSVENLMYQFAQACMKRVMEKPEDKYAIANRFGDGADLHRHSIDDFLLEYGRRELYRYDIDGIKCHNYIDAMVTLRDLQDKGNASAWVKDLMGYNREGLVALKDITEHSRLGNRLCTPTEISRDFCNITFSYLGDKSTAYKDIEAKCRNSWYLKEDYKTMLIHKGYSFDGDIAILNGKPTGERIEIDVLGEKPSCCLARMSDNEYTAKADCGQKRQNEEKTVIGNAVEYMGMLLSAIEQLQCDENVSIPMHPLDVERAKESYLKLGELQDTLRQPDFQKAMQTLTKPDVSERPNRTQTVQKS